MEGMSADPWDAVAEHLDGLEGIRVHEDPRGCRWCVSNRLVARQVDAELLLIRSDFEPRERLLEEHAETFSVRPALEGHQKILADVTNGDLAAITAALDAAWAMQRRPR